MTRPVPPGAARRLCLSRRHGEICTREDGHRGLHHRVGTGLLWSDRDADPPECPGGGRAATPAETLEDGYPHGRGLCPVCWGFVRIEDGVLARHDSWRGDHSRAEAALRREWFNTHGW